MADILTLWSGTNGDWVQAGADLATGDDLETAVLISLFTDRQAAPDDAIPDGSADPRGWWGDLGAEAPIGSKIWLLSRSKQTAQTLAAAKSYIADALQWLIDDGIAARIDVAADWGAPGFLETQVDLWQAAGTRRTVAFRWAWDQLGAA